MKKKDFFKEVDSLFNNNKELIDKLAEEKRLLENLFLDNRIPKEFKRDLLTPYNTLTKMVEKRVDIDKSLKQAKKISNLIGILYNETQYTYLSSILKNLQELCNRRKISVICFTLGDVNLDEGLVKGLVVDTSFITDKIVSIPECAFNIGRYSKAENIDKIKKMNMLYSSTVINPINIFNQAVIFDILSSVQAIKESILPVSMLSPTIILDYLSNSNTVFLLPERHVYNTPAFKIEKNLQNKRNNCIIETGGSCEYCGEKNLYMYVKKMIANKRYVALQGKKTLLWNGAPLEARVYVQKGLTGKWGITEMIAKNEIFFNDSIYKDTVDELDRTLINIIPDSAKAIMQRLSSISLNTCSYMDYYLSNLGSCSIDFIIDAEGNPFIIGFDGWDYKNYLFKLNGKHSWDKYIANCVDYLLYLKHTGGGR